MAHGMHLGDPVEITTDKFAKSGAARGSVGVIVDDWADGSNDIEVSNPRTGDVVARFRAAPDEIRPFSGVFDPKEPREHGILFGRGDELQDDVEPPPTTYNPTLFQIPGYTPEPIPFGDPPQETIEVEGDIPWELRDEPPAKPTEPVIL